MAVRAKNHGVDQGVLTPGRTWRLVVHVTSGNVPAANFTPVALFGDSCFCPGGSVRIFPVAPKDAVFHALVPSRMTFGAVVSAATAMSGGTFHKIASRHIFRPSAIAFATPHQGCVFGFAYTFDSDKFSRPETSQIPGCCFHCDGWGKEPHKPNEQPDVSLDARHHRFLREQFLVTPGAPGVLTCPVGDMTSHDAVDEAPRSCQRSWGRSSCAVLGVRAANLPSSNSETGRTQMDPSSA